MISKKWVKAAQNYLREVSLFISQWGKWWYDRGYQVFSRLEKVKDLFTYTLYRQRGRFSRPFVHAAMGGLMASGLMLAPVLAQSFPGVAEDPWAQSAPSSMVREITDDGTTTVISDKVRDRIIEYPVQPGDTISTIAAKYDVDADTIRWENNLASVNSIKPGQILRILPVPGVSHKVARGETIYTIAKKYNANAQAVVDFPFNTFTDDETFALAVGQALIIPEGKKPNVIPWNPNASVAQRTPNAGAVSATGNFVWPLGGLITQRFAWYHKGMDIATSFGTAILAADAGKIIVAGWPDNSGYGNRVIIDHNNGYTSLYAHMSRVDVTIGQTVQRGDRVGLEGSTGRSTGPHLHFEIRKGGAAVNPLLYLK